MRAVSDSRRRCRKLGHFAGLFVGLLLIVLWLVAAHRDLGLINRDWVAFDRAGWRGLGGDWVAAYRESADERWPYLYPPLSLPISLPLGLLPYEQSYWVCFIAVLIGLWWSCRRLHEVVGDQAGRYLVFCSALLIAPTTLQVLITGQWSWLYLMALAALAASPVLGQSAAAPASPPLLAAPPVPSAAGRASFLQRRLWEDATPSTPLTRRAPYCLVLLALKPNLAVFAVLFLVILGQWQMLRRWLVALATVVGLTAPFAWAAWVEFVRAVAGVAQRQESGNAPVDKQATLLAFLRVLSGDLAGSTMVWAVWLVVVVPMLVLAAMACRRVMGQDRYRLRLVGLLALVMVAANPRLYFYDALVLALPAAAWYLDRDSYDRSSGRRMGGLCLAGIVVSSFVFFPIPAAVTAIGLFATLWSVVESVDLLRVASGSASASPAGPRRSLATPVPIGTANADQAATV